MRAPFPWFGGKSRVAPIVWERFGDVRNYVEPFFGSGAVLLNRPQLFNGPETVNDLDCYLSNFWRAVKTEPEAVAMWADWPVNEADLLARHKWLINQSVFRDRMRTIADYYDPKIAGWWLWGICAWIGSGWCKTEAQQIPHLGTAGRGINRKLPHLGNAGRGEAIAAYMSALADRLRDVRVACGDWSRVLGESVTFKHGLTGVFLDPPYSPDEHSIDYLAGTGKEAAEVRQWAIENGNNPLLRIALCGYEGEHAMPADWQEVKWKAGGGYGSQGSGRGRDNASRERVWFSPHCLKPEAMPSQIGLFEGRVA